MKASIIVLVALGMVAAFCASLLVALMGRDTTRTRAHQPVAVLVAKHDMPSMTVVTEGVFEEATIDAADAPAGAIHQPLLIVGKPLTRAVVKGQPLTRDCFALNSLGVELASTIAKGKRAMTVELKLSSGLEGLLYPGSLVDVLASYHITHNADEGAAVSTTLLQGVEVLAIDSETVGSSDEAESDIKVTVNKAEDVSLRRKTRRVTLLVDPRQAASLQLASENGQISLVMRNPLDDQRPKQDPILLHQGRLAAEAEFLESSVPNGEPAGPTQGLFGTGEQPAADKSAHRRDVTVLRGTAVEVRSLTMDESAGAKTAERF